MFFIVLRSYVCRILDLYQVLCDIARHEKDKKGGKAYDELWRRHMVQYKINDFVNFNQKRCNLPAFFLVAAAAFVVINDDFVMVDVVVFFV
jgi:hypothetical protein